jgi:hypothetical protein
LNFEYFFVWWNNDVVSDKNLLIEIIVGGLIGHALVALIPAHIARQKGRSYAGFYWLAFFGTFLTAMLVVIAIPSRIVVQKPKASMPRGGNDEWAAPPDMACPFCAETIKIEAKVCRFCANNVESASAKIVEAAENRRRIFQESRNEEIRLARESAAQKVALKQAKSDNRRKAFLVFVKSKSFVFVVAALLILVGIGVVTYWQLFNAQLSEAHQSEKLTSDFSRAVASCQIKAGFNGEIVEAEIKVVRDGENIVFSDCLIPRLIDEKLLAADFVETFKNSYLIDSKIDTVLPTKLIRSNHVSISPTRVEQFKRGTEILLYRVRFNLISTSLH